MKEKKLIKRLNYVIERLNDLGLNISVHTLESEGKAISSYLDSEGDWQGDYIGTYEYHFWNFCVLDDNKLDEYENKAIYARMEYDVGIDENYIDMIIYFKKDKTVEIVGMDYHCGADFYYKIEGKFKEKFDLALKDFMKDYHLFNC